jgi:hypothetical protein
MLQKREISGFGKLVISSFPQNYPPSFHDETYKTETAPGRRARSPPQPGTVTQVKKLFLIALF